MSRHSGAFSLELLAVLFIALKLLGVVDWSWWWVTAPLWGGLALALAACAILGGGLTAVYWIDKWKQRRSK